MQKVYIKNSKIPCSFNSKLILSIICGNCRSNDNTISKEQNLVLINNKRVKVLHTSNFVLIVKSLLDYTDLFSSNKYGTKNTSLNFRLRKINETKIYFLAKITLKDLISKKHNKLCLLLNYIEQSLVLVSAITGFVSVSAFISLIVIPVGIGSSVLGVEICG